MKQMNDRTQLGQPPAAGQPAPRKHFRIQKLEERIAPKGRFQCHPKSMGHFQCY